MMATCSDVFLVLSGCTQSLKVSLIASLIEYTHNSLSGNQCLTNWVSSQVISQQAAHLGELTDVDSKDQWLFPQLNVTCLTTITKIRFVGERFQEGNRIPELQIWRKTSPTSNRYSKVHHTQGAVVTTVQSSLHAISVSWQVQSGDVFGVYQSDLRRSRYSFAMQEGGGATSYVMGNQRRARDRFDTSRYDAIGHSYPLVTVEAGKYVLTIWLQLYNQLKDKKFMDYEVLWLSAEIFSLL